MPPQQAHYLLDFGDGLLDLGAHVEYLSHRRCRGHLRQDQPATKGSGIGRPTSRVKARGKEDVMLRELLVVTALGVGATVSHAQDVSVERGAHIAIIGGCHDCHTAGYAGSNGQIDPEAALKGDAVGFQGPWGTTYPSNLRIVAAGKSEDEWVEYLKTFEARPPMPWFNVHQFAEADMRALHRYILSLGEPGEPAPAFVPPGEKPTTPYVVFAPPIMP
jgi:hypothetical protein